MLRLLSCGRLLSKWCRDWSMAWIVMICICLWFTLFLRQKSRSTTLLRSWLRDLKTLKTVKIMNAQIKTKWTWSLWSRMHPRQSRTFLAPQSTKKNLPLRSRPPKTSDTNQTLKFWTVSKTAILSVMNQSKSLNHWSRGSQWLANSSFTCALSWCLIKFTSFTCLADKPSYSREAYRVCWTTLVLSEVASSSRENKLRCLATCWGPSSKKLSSMLWGYSRMAASS